ncbi:NADH:flavin oxidoreductase/12-oxophytodienoate reductase [Aspergillus oryzae 100-8]|uniref:Flavin oxidoreductase/12-oxophytodienoate reductase n=1 Tax=Aspergillus oryzae (strain 3.042) TaxID=1160506 RepID=I8U3K9_ASPO3|nr:flavin oxidoreductase/12-oxophytodienoate reductase [Aspergillus oryzae 3.042]KDE84067.1 NADH:flavin oxidoreductase/12-oxophytodienoate reductase [Aspergillus oryzae 100-8]|eukprot:EIT81298.1 flavin oxidoreductase/12-oxophytodienoate reductase [Aspergillus oryzae 3.042]
MARAGQAVDPSPLGEPLEFHFARRSTPNRFLKAAMSERMCSWSEENPSARGIPSSELIETYRTWGRGNIGAIVTGNVMIDPNHIEVEGNPIIPPSAPFSGERFGQFTNLAAAARANGSLILAQISHPALVSDVPLDTKNMGNTFAVPRAATEDEIKNIITGFAHAAEFLDRAGYDGIELHAAHGYLLSQFLSQATNLRRDKYGGSPTNRMRLILEIRAAITENVRPGFIVGIKINSVEFEPDGIVRDEAWELCRAREEHEFDFVELSGGRYKNLDEDDTAKHVISKKHEAVRFRSTAGMVDGIGLARPFCQEPFLCHDILSGKIPGATIPVMDQLNYQLAVAAACIQMRQIRNNVQPMDLSSQDAVDAVTAAVKG